MAPGIIGVLLVEDNPGDARLLREALAEVRSARYDITHVETLAKALKSVAAQPYDVILLDLMLADSQGLASLAEVYTRSPDTPIVILSGLSDDRTAVEAVQAGAEDFLVKGQVSGATLARTISHAIERHQMQIALRSLSTLSALAGLYSRRGFLPLARQYTVLAQSAHKGLTLFLVHMETTQTSTSWPDALAEHQALVKAAEILRPTFRAMDIVAHLGENTFAVLTFDASPPVVSSLSARLEQSVAEYNARPDAVIPLSLRMATALFDPNKPVSLDALMASAERSLAEQMKKKGKKRSL